jgi:carbamoyl-phosphate synthase large subunit
MGTPFDAVDLAEDRQRFAALLGALGIRCPDWGIASNRDDAARIASRIGYPILVRPSYVLGGRSMRVCYSPDDIGVIEGTVLVDRFVESAVEIDVDAVCDGTHTFVGAVMQHVEEAGVHSGDSACVLPAPSLTRDEDEEIRAIVERLAVALGVVGLINVQLALADGEIYVLEANPRASRTVPFASKATGVNLVEAACRVMGGAALSSLNLPSRRSLDHVAVKAAVLPFARFPGADPILGPEMRSTGEVMASATDFPSAFAKAERAAGRALPSSGTAFLSVRDADKAALVPVASTLAGLGFRLLATGGTARALEHAGLEVEHVRKVTESGEGASVVDLIRRGRCDLVINTPFGSGARTDGYLIREAALVARVPCITTLAGAAAAVHAIANARREESLSLQERIHETRAA